MVNAKLLTNMLRHRRIPSYKRDHFSLWDSLMEFGTMRLILKRDKQTGQRSSCTEAYLSLSVDCVTLIGLPWRVSEDFTQITCS